FPRSVSASIGDVRVTKSRVLRQALLGRTFRRRTLHSAPQRERRAGQENEARMNAIQALTEYGQSIWLDYIRRDMTRSGELQRMIDDGLRGMTSNPAIFQKSIGGGGDYTATLTEFGADPELDAKGLYERIAIEDIREACDVMLPLYRRCERRDGFVSLEVAPALARDGAGTIAEAHRLWAAVDRPNLMIKVPAPTEGLFAIEALIRDRLNVNATLILSCAQDLQVAAASPRR